MIKWAESLTSGQLFIIYSLIMLIGYYSQIKWPALSFLAFATQFTIGFIGALVNRYFKSKNETALKLAADTSYCAGGTKI